MKAKSLKDSYLIRLEIGEEVLSSLSTLVRRKGIRSGWLQGIGAVNDVTLGVYDLEQKTYEKRLFHNDHELVNLTGDISWLGRDPVLHVHAVIADSKLRTYGGHLFGATCCVTVEVLLTPSPVTIQRRRDERTGLNLLVL
jgi:predicted DNA-binding protein with PD1-like motif